VSKLANIVDADSIRLVIISWTLFLMRVAVPPSLFQLFQLSLI